jgi:hypothetical protein
VGFLGGFFGWVFLLPTLTLSIFRVKIKLSVAAKPD